MINLEFYRDEIIEKFKNIDAGKYVECVLCEVREKTYDCRKPCYQCIEDSFDWLLEEYREPIKLKQWEYDLLDIYSRPNSKFKQHELFLQLSAKGHFEGVIDTSMEIKEILDNCEVELE